jgi:oxygen-independent coproporphyrinogen-3 oxidase
MDKALAGTGGKPENEVSRADLPFEFMLNALRLRKASNCRTLPRNRPGLTAIRALDEERKGLLSDFVNVRP